MSDSTRARWTDAEIGEQQRRVNRAAPNRLYYERGRLDCMLGKVVQPNASSTEKLQWEVGWRDEYQGNERPFDGEEA